MIPIIKEKLPDDFKLLISIKFGGNVWNPGNFLKINSQ